MPEQNTPTPILPADIQKGDRIRRTEVEEYVAEDMDIPTRRISKTYELIERPVTLPTEPGLYSSLKPVTYGAYNPYFLDSRGVWHELQTIGSVVTTKEDVAEFAPFALLRPVPEVAAEVLAGVLHDYTTATSFTNLHEVTQALAAKYGATL